MHLGEKVGAEPIETIRGKTRAIAEQTKGPRKPYLVSPLESRIDQAHKRTTGLRRVFSAEHDQASLRKACRAGVPFAVGSYRRAGLYFSSHSL
jgi:hypothetical protein